MAMSYKAFNLVEKANMLKWICLIFPHYSLSSSLNNLNMISTTERVCDQRCHQMPFGCDRDSLCRIVKECCRKCKAFLFIILITNAYYFDLQQKDILNGLSLESGGI